MPTTLALAMGRTLVVIVRGSPKKPEQQAWLSNYPDAYARL
jgi:hypothetical protein